MSLHQIGSLWVNESEDGDNYLSGQAVINMEESRLVAFQNDNKEKGSEPDYRLYLSLDEDEKAGQASGPKQAKKGAGADNEDVDYPDGEDVTDDDIPF